MRRCDESPPGQLLLAVRQFNAREWFECHETLEDLWIGEEGEIPLWESSSFKCVCWVKWLVSFDYTVNQMYQFFHASAGNHHTVL